VAGKTVRVRVRCRAAYVKVLEDVQADERIAIGLEFKEFESKGRERLERFVAECLMPVGM